MAENTIETPTQEKKPKKKLGWSILAGVVLLGAIGGGIYTYQNNQVESEMTEKAFAELKDKPMEVIDTSAFSDKKLEKWYLKNRQTKGEFLFHKDGDTYILVSVGKVKNSDTYLLINGVKEEKDKLLIGYDTMEIEESSEIKFEDDIRAAVIKVEGNYDEINVIDVKEEVEKIEEDPDEPDEEEQKIRHEKMKEEAKELTKDEIKQLEKEIQEEAVENAEAAANGTTKETSEK